MLTQLLPDRLALPPPLELDLTDDDRVVGWIIGDRLGFGGFSTRVDAAHAAWLAHQTLMRRLGRSGGMRPIAIEREPLALQQRDGREVLLASGRPIADLVSPGADRLSGGHSFERPFGFEIQVPPPADELRVRAMAHLIYRTLRRSGLRWALQTPATTAVAPSAAPATARAGDAGAAGSTDNVGPGERRVAERLRQGARSLLVPPWRRARRVGRRPSNRIRAVREQ